MTPNERLFEIALMAINDFGDDESEDVDIVKSGLIQLREQVNYLLEALSD